MKYIITESQYNVLLESGMRHLLRRMNSANDYWKKLLMEAEMPYMLREQCKDFENPSEYSELIIKETVRKFNSKESFAAEIFLSDKKTKNIFLEHLKKHLTENFKEWLEEQYIERCSERSEEEEKRELEYHRNFMSKIFQRALEDETT